MSCAVSTVPACFKLHEALVGSRLSLPFRPCSFPDVKDIVLCNHNFFLSCFLLFYLLKALSDREIRKEFFICIRIPCFSGYQKYVKNIVELPLKYGLSVYFQKLQDCSVRGLKDSGKTHFDCISVHRHTSLF